MAKTQGKTMELNKVILGDSMDVLKLIEANSIDGLITDPPYNISQDNNFTTMKDGRGGQVGYSFGEWDKDFDLISWLDLAIPLIKPNGNIIIFNDWKNLGIIAEKLESLYCDVKRPLIWHKPNPTPFNRDRCTVNAFEFALWAVKGRKVKHKDGTTGIKTSGWTFNRQRANFEDGLFTYPSNSRNEHPTQKSLKLIDEMINIFTNPNDIILDPFSGSATISLSAKNNNRNFIGIEKELKYWTLGNNRLT